MESHKIILAAAGGLGAYFIYTKMRDTGGAAPPPPMVVGQEVRQIAAYKPTTVLQTVDQQGSYSYGNVGVDAATFVGASDQNDPSQSISAPPKPDVVSNLGALQYLIAAKGGQSISQQQYLELTQGTRRAVSYDTGSDAIQRFKGFKTDLARYAYYVALSGTQGQADIRKAMFNDDLGAVGSWLQSVQSHNPNWAHTVYNDDEHVVWQLSGQNASIVP